MAIVYNTSIIRDGLVLYLDAANTKSYPGSGTTWYDLSGNNNNGSMVSGVTYSSTAPQRMSFNGTSQYVSVPSHSTINPATNGTFTLSFWIRPNTLTTAWYRSIVVHETYLASGYRLGIGPTGVIKFWATQSGGTVDINSGSTLIAANVWSNICVVYSAQNASLYVNSTLAGSGSGTYISGSNAFNLGAAIQEYFSGDVGVTVMYNNNALTSSQVKQNFDSLRGRYGI